MLSKLSNILTDKRLNDDQVVPHFTKPVLPQRPNMVNINRLEDINERISERNLPSNFLQQQFSIRPVPTKYSMMPILDTRAPSSVPIIYKQPYNINSTFNPGSSAPFSGFSSHINDESRLRNQFFALQKCEQSVYVPPSDSDMYHIRVTGGERKDPQLFPGLFEKPEMAPFNPNTLNIGKNFFENHTRVQVKGLETAKRGQRSKQM
jgi:hypothetical protein